MNEITTENLEDKLEKGIVVIRVEKNWTMENEIDRDNVAMFEFDENSSSWNELPTAFTEEDDNNYYYEVELNSFSYFAIGEKVKVEAEEEKVGFFKKVGEFFGRVWNAVKPALVTAWSFVKIYWIQFIAGAVAIALIIVGVVLLKKGKNKGRK